MSFNKDQDYWANIFVTPDFLSVETYSGLGMTGRDPLFSPRLLQPDVDDKSLGEEILQALSDSRTLDVFGRSSSFFSILKKVKSNMQLG